VAGKLAGDGGVDGQRARPRRQPVDPVRLATTIVEAVLSCCFLCVYVCAVYDQRINNLGDCGVCVCLGKLLSNPWIRSLGVSLYLELSTVFSATWSLLPSN